LLNLWKVFQRFREARLKLNPEKCQLLQTEVVCLRHIISPERITTDPENLKSVGEWPTQKNKHEIKSFLDLCAYYRRFVSGFTNVAKPLTKLSEENHAFQWTPNLETALCTAPVLAYPQSRERFVVDSDASKVGIVGVLSQVQDRQERVIAYYSKTLNKAERNYCVSRRELHAIVRTWNISIGASTDKSSTHAPATLH
jgi:hypothetical protein